MDLQKTYNCSPLLEFNSEKHGLIKWTWKTEIMQNDFPKPIKKQKVRRL